MSDQPMNYQKIEINPINTIQDMKYRQNTKNQDKFQNQRSTFN